MELYFMVNSYDKRKTLLRPIKNFGDIFIIKNLTSEFVTDVEDPVTNGDFVGLREGDLVIKTLNHMNLNNLLSDVLFVTTQGMESKDAKKKGTKK